MRVTAIEHRESQLSIYTYECGEWSIAPPHIGKTTHPLKPEKKKSN